MNDEPEQPQNDESARTEWHQILGHLFELLFAGTGVNVNVDFNLMSQPPRSDILLIRMESPVWTAEHRSRLPDGVRDSQASHILLEFKYTESLNEQRIKKTHAYHTLYQQKEGLSDEQLATFVLSSKTPRSTLLTKYGYQPTRWPGVYQSDQLMVDQVGLLVLNKLSDAPHNAYVKCFASQHQAKESAFKVLMGLVIKNFPKGLWLFLVGLSRLILQKGETEVLKIEVTAEDVMNLGEEWRALILATIPPEERLMGLKPEERLTGLKPEERLTGLKPEERLMGLKPEERLMGLKPEEVLSQSQYQRYLEEQKQQTERISLSKTIRRTLRVRFKLSPETLEQYDKPLSQLEVATLDELSELALTADSWAEFETQLNQLLPPDDDQ